MFLLALALVFGLVVGGTAVYGLLQIVFDLQDEVENLQEIVFELFERHG